MSVKQLLVYLLARNGNHGVDEPVEDVLVLDVEELLVEGHRPEVGRLGTAFAAGQLVTLKWKLIYLPSVCSPTHLLTHPGSGLVIIDSHHP